MPYDPSIHHRRSIRLPHYDYSSRGAYFVTICAQKRLSLFGAVRDGTMNLNEGGRLIEKLWQELETYAGITIDRFVVMPNHLHGIVWIGAQPEKESGSTKLPAPAKDPGRTRGSAPTLAAVVQRYKTLTTNRYAAGVRNSNWPPFPNRLWQTNYFEHIIRDDQSLQSVRYYIENNPARWMNDVENPHGDGTDDVEQFVATLRPNTPQHLPSDIDLLLDNHS